MEDGVDTQTIADRAGATVDDIRNIGLMYGDPVSIDMPVYDSDGRSVSRHEVMPHSAPTPDAILMDNDVKDRIAQALSTLTPREQEIIRRRFFGTDETLKDIGDDPSYGLSR